MNVEVTKLPESRVALTIELTPEEVEGVLDRTYKQLVQRVNIPGFRKGKAPRPVVERMVGHDLFLHEATDEAVRWGYRKAVDQENITPIDQAEINAHPDGHDHDDSHVAPGEPFVFEATVSVRPEVQLPDYHALRVERQVTEVTDDDVDKLLEELRERNATLEPTIRPAQIGDIATVNITGRSGGEEVLSNDNADFELRDEEKDGPDPILPGLSAELVGVNRGEIRETVLTLPEDFGNEELAGKSLALRVLVKEIKRRVLPDLNDELAQSISEHQTLDDLRAALRANLEAEAEVEADEKLTQDAVREVTSRTFIDIPPVLIEEEVDQMMDDLRETFERRGLSWQTYLDITQRPEQEIRSEMREGATENVKTTLVLSAVAEAEGIEVSNADINTALDELLRVTNASGTERRQMRQSPTVRSNVRSRMRRQRAIRKLVEIMTGESALSDTPMTDEPADADEIEETEAVEVSG